jgi:hypothetical protein
MLFGAFLKFYQLKFQPTAVPDPTISVSMFHADFSIVNDIYLFGHARSLVGVYVHATMPASRSVQTNIEIFWIGNI